MSTINNKSYSSPKNINLKQGILRFNDTHASNPLGSSKYGLYINTSDELVFVYKGSEVTVGAAGAGASLSAWDDLYAHDETLTISAGSLTFNVTADVDGLTINGSADVDAGALLQFASTGDAKDIQGTSDTWNVSKAGLVTCVGLTTTSDITSTGAAIDWDLKDNDAAALSIDASGKAGIIAIVTTNGSEAVTMSGLLTVAGTLTGSTGIASSDGTSTFTDNANNAQTIIVTNDTMTTAYNASDGGIVEITSSSLTTGVALQLSLDYSELAGGYFIRCWDQDGSTAEFTVGEDGATVITGNATGTDALTLTDGDITVTSGDVTMTVGNLLLSDGNVNITESSTSTAALTVAAGVTSADAVVITADSLTGTESAVSISVDALVDGVGLKIEGIGEALTSGELLQIINNEGAGNLATISGNLCSITSTLEENAGTLTADYDMLLLSRTDKQSHASQYDAQGSLLKILKTQNKAAGTIVDAVVNLEIESVSTGSALILGDSVKVTSVGVNERSLNIINACTGKDAVLITASGALTNGLAGLHVTVTGNVATGGAGILIDQNTGTPNTAARMLEIEADGVDMIAVYIDVDAATEDGFYMQSDGATASGKAVMHVNCGGTPADDTGAVIKASFDGTDTYESMIFYAAGTGKDVVGIYIDTDNTVAANSGNIVVYNNTTAAQGPSIVGHHDSSSPAANDQLLGIYSYGEEGTSSDTMLYGQMTFEVVAEGDGVIEGGIKMGVADGASLRESFYLTDDTLNLGDSAAFVLGSTGAYDLSISTKVTAAGLTGAEPKIVLTDGSTGDITLTPGTTGLVRLIAGAPTVTSKTTTATLTEAEGGIILVTTGSAWTATLPAASGNAGLWYAFKKTDAPANALTIDGNSAETIDGAATHTAVDAQYDTVTIVCDGSNWHVIAEDLA